ncbi:alpha/beta fold hydrolase [Patulibacter minatonensis]|uniref:alpha/beta fold hydrolase n=1 Tax=Patulibacter minatonensis TaxID=298163 RepID=UPI0004AEB85F|nr:alpha/beta hydrolase [Patulibacter minatonensis]
MNPRPAISERSTVVAGFRTRVLEVGTGLPAGSGGAPILLLHGYSDSADTWRRVLRLLADRGQRAAAVDLPGFGHADRLLPDEPMLEQYVRVVHAASRMLWGDEAPILAGNSMGGAVALRCAEELPSPAGVVPIGPAGFDHPGWFRVIEQQPLLRWALNDAMPVPGPVLRTITARVFKQLAYGDPSLARREDLEAFASHFKSARDIRRLLATGRRLKGELVAPFHLDRVTCPVLLVWGERDRMVTCRGSRHLLAALPDARYERLARVGHCPQLEVPELVCDLLTGFRCALRAEDWDAAPVGHEVQELVAA